MRAVSQAELEGTMFIVFGDFSRLLASLGWVFCPGAAITGAHSKSYPSKSRPRDFGRAQNCSIEKHGVPPKCPFRS